MIVRAEHRGMKLVDLMVVVVVIAVVLTVTVPYLSDARVEGRRTVCLNNMRQLGVALTQFQSSNHHFPNAGTFVDDPAIHQGDPTRSNLYKAVIDPSAFASGTSPCLYNWVVDILPYLEASDLALWDKTLPYDSPASISPNQPSNALFSSRSLPILRCPDGPTALSAGGPELSYVVNGGFVRWPAVPVSWDGSAKDGQSRTGPALEWTPAGTTWRDSMAVSRKLGVMFLGTEKGNAPWDIRTTAADIVDGQSATILIGENTLAGYSSGNAYSGGLATNWACPLPNFCMFIASDDVCHSAGSTTNCLAGQLQPTPAGTSGPGWGQANQLGGTESINFGAQLKVKGSFPFLNSGHPGFVNVVMCDGSTRSIRETIDGKVYAELITPAGAHLPAGLRQQPQPSYNPKAPPVFIERQ